MTLRMDRRAVIGGGLAAVAALAAPPAAAHTMYGQWVRYRQANLLLACHKADPDAFAQAKALEAVFAAELPEAKLRVARAPFPGRVAALLATDQIRVALLQPHEVLEVAAGQGEFAPYGPVALALLCGLPGRMLVCRADMPARHTWLLRSVLVEAALPSPAEAAFELGLHPGALAHDSGVALEMLPEA